ncbi:MAG TPA: hypothetical protein PLX89_19330 [Verrucomicrobiota bacterium]|nr:hypothetical protein [Verrucomicrobiales bacterium]HRI15153.1 hypothetical protein [Verrucomicrobiota bacterium]
MDSRLRSISRPSKLAHQLCNALALVAIGSELLAFTPGELDTRFDPDPSIVSGVVSRLTVKDGDVYFSSPGTRFRRFREDGSLDESWRLNSPVPVPLALTATPFGGWVVRGSPASYLEQPDGTIRPVPSFLLVAPYYDFPQDDGSVVVEGVGRAAPDGNVDYKFMLHRWFNHAPFSDGAGFVQSGAVFPTAVQDRQGRFIVVGNFYRAGGIDRLGLVRFTTNGIPDPDWNPGPVLGVALNETNALTRLPYSLALGLDDSVVVGLRLPSTDGLPNSRLVVIRSDGTVASEIKRYGEDYGWPPLVQPDGRMIVGGIFDSWGETPAAGLVRLNSDGSVDATFSVTLTHTNRVMVRTMAADESGRLWFAGNFDSVNGVARPRLARIFAWEPIPAVPALEINQSPPRVGTNEFLHLAARVTGYPPPELQWYRDGAPVPGATNRGLRLPISTGAELGEFSLVASNDLGTNRIDFRTVELATRSPRLGQVDPSFERVMTNFPRVIQMVPRSDGRMLVGGGIWSSGTTLRQIMVARITADGNFDPSFGTGGVVRGNGEVESLRLLPDGGILVAGQFTEFAGLPATGLAELDSNGQRVSREFPRFERPQVMTVLPTPEGGYLVGGAFTNVAGIPVRGLVRLTANLSVDPTFQSPLEPWHGVDQLEFDLQGRLLVAGERTYATGPVPSPLGLVRLLENGSIDPVFARVTNGVRYLFVEPEHTLLVGVPPRRVSEDGQIIAQFDVIHVDDTTSSRIDLGYRMARLPDGGVIATRTRMRPRELIRWRGDGTRDFAFFAEVGTPMNGPDINAVVVLPEGEVLVAISGGLGPIPEGHNQRIRRLLPDSDLRWNHPQVVGNQFVAEVTTHTERTYEVQRRATLDQRDTLPVGSLPGDGFIQEVVAPATAPSQFLELQIQPAP